MSELILTHVVIEEPRRRVVGERGPDGKVFYGHAVVRGKVRFLSVSSIKKFDPEYDGCNRRWYYQFIDGKKETSTKAQLSGTDYAKQLERYLKTGVDDMQPVLRAAKHLFPKPGSDLELEKDLAVDIGKALALRELLFDPARAGDKLAEAEMRGLAGLTAAGVPLVGAADVRHRRGEYIDEGGVLRNEDKGMRVVSVDDLKTTKRINDHVTRGGKVLSGWALTAEEVVDDVQMVGYGVHAGDLYPDTTHVRLAHNYAQTENGFAAARRMGLVTVDRVRRRWHDKVEPVVREIEGVAAAACAQDVSTNTGACRSFGRECPHMSYCQPTRTLADVFSFGDYQQGVLDMSNGNGLFDTLTALVAPNGVSQPPSLPSPPVTEDLGIFGSPQAPTPPPIPSPVMGDEERQRQIAEAKEKLRNPLAGLEGYKQGQDCNGLGWYQSSDRSGHVAIEIGHTCPKCAKLPQVPSVGAVNPLDAPAFDPVQASKPLTEVEIAAIEDPEIRSRATAIALAVQQRAAVEALEKGVGEKKTSGNCSVGGTTVLLTDKEKVSRNKVCPGCAKVLRIKDKDFTHDLTSMVIPKHRLRAEAVPPKPPVAVTPPQVSPPPVPPALPSPPVAPPVPPAPPTTEGSDDDGIVQRAKANEAPLLQPPVLPPVSSPSAPAVGPNTQMMNEMFGTPRVDTLPPLPTEPVTSAVAPMNSLTLIKHIVQSVALGLDSREMAFDKIAAVLAR